MLQQIITNAPAIIDAVCTVGMVIVILATVIVRLTPTKKDDEFVGSAADKFLKLMAYLPTFGINPRTKKLEEAYAEIKVQLSEVEAKVEAKTDAKAS